MRRWALQFDRPPRLLLRAGRMENVRVVARFVAVARLARIRLVAPDRTALRGASNSQIDADGRAHHVQRVALTLPAPESVAILRQQVLEVYRACPVLEANAPRMVDTICIMLSFLRKRKARKIETASLSYRPWRRRRSSWSGPSSRDRDRECLYYPNAPSHHPRPASSRPAHHVMSETPRALRGKDGVGLTW